MYGTLRPKRDAGSKDFGVRIGTKISMRPFSILFKVQTNQ
jgi:hypothetical protein